MRLLHMLLRVQPGIRDCGCCCNRDVVVLTRVLPAHCLISLPSPQVARTGKALACSCSQRRQ